jgi:hypothetical protein
MATQMVRKQIYIKKRQDILLKQLSQARGLSEAEIIRQALEREAGLRSRVAGDSAGNRIAAWAGILRFVQERKSALSGEDKPVKWDRQELYEEREERWSKLKDGD